MPLQPVISNTSPIIKLAGVGLLHLLHELYGKVSIPEAVSVEFHQKARANDPDLITIPWLVVQSVTVDPSLTMLNSLGVGEVAAITLAQSSNAALLIIDDRLGRQIAQTRQIRVTGTIGVLLEAKQVGLLPAVRPVIDEMIAQGRYISPNLRLQVLKIAGET